MIETGIIEEEEELDELEKKDERTCTYSWECSNVSSMKDPDNNLIFCEQKCQTRYHNHKKRELELPFETDIDLFRDLWRLHVSLTRQVIIELSRNGNKDDTEEVNKIVNELLDNQNHIGNKFKPMYGREVGTTVSDLLIEHIKLYKKVIMEVVSI